jgi:hypothetical protein
MMMTSICREYWQVVLAQGLVVGIGAGCMLLPSVAVMPQVRLLRAFCYFHSLHSVPTLRERFHHFSGHSFQNHNAKLLDSISPVSELLQPALLPLEVALVSTYSPAPTPLPPPFFLKSSTFPMFHFSKSTNLERMIHFDQQLMPFRRRNIPYRFSQA